jgi:hypothetical protein
LCQQIIGTYYINKNAEKYTKIKALANIYKTLAHLKTLADTKIIGASKNHGGS